MNAGCVPLESSNGTHSATVANDSSLQLASGKVLSAGSEIEAWGQGGELVVWMAEDDPALYVYDERSDTTRSLPAPVEAESICLAPQTNHADVFDLFLGDGDGAIFQYWLLLGSDIELREVRKLWTNPDVERCWVTADALVIDNGPLGPTAYTRSPEHDDVMSLGNEPFMAGYAQVASVTPDFETQPVASAGDAADDPVVLVGIETAWIVGTDKQWGLHAYDLSGAQVASAARGRLNNVDAVATQTGYLLAASNRSTHSIDLFTVDVDQAVLEFTGAIPIDVNDPYGLCMGRRNDEVLVFVGGTDGEVQVWQTNSRTQIDTLRFASQTEGCAYDALHDHLYVGEEAQGVWRVNLGNGERTLVAQVGVHDLVADVEGVDICRIDDARVLVISSQGDDSYMLWPLDVNEPTGVKFRVTADPRARLDGASETDGLACINRALPAYPKGVLVVQDGRNRAPREAQNFKVIDWRKIEDLYHAATP